MTQEHLRLSYGGGGGYLINELTHCYLTILNL